MGVGHVDVAGRVGKHRCRSEEPRREAGNVVEPRIPARVAVARKGPDRAAVGLPNAVRPRVGDHERAVRHLREPCRSGHSADQRAHGRGPLRGGWRRSGSADGQQHRRDGELKTELQEIGRHPLDARIAQRSIEAAGPVDAAGAEDQCPARRRVDGCLGVAGLPLGVHQRRAGDDLDRRGRVELEGAVVLVTDELGDAVALPEAGALVHGMPGIENRPGLAEQHPALVHRADELLFRAIDRRVPESARLLGRAGERIVLRLPLVAGDQARVAVDAGIGEADLPVPGVRAEEIDGHARVAGGVDGVALLHRPVLVVPRGDESTAAEQGAVTLAGDVEVRGVRDVVAVALEVPRHQRLVPQDLSAAVVARVRPIEAHLHGECAGRVVEAGAAPVVVGLRREHRRVHHQICRAIVLDHQRNQDADLVLAHDANEVQAAHGILRHRHRERRRPGAADETGTGILRAGRLRARLRRSAGESARAIAAVPTEAIERPAHLAAAVRAHHQLDRVAGLRTDAVCVRFDLRRPRVGESAVPRRVAALLVLPRNRVGVSLARRRPASSVGRFPCVGKDGIDERSRLSTRERKDDACPNTRPPHGRKLGSTASGSKPRETDGQRGKCLRPVRVRSRMGHS